MEKIANVRFRKLPFFSDLSYTLESTFWDFDELLPPQYYSPDWKFQGDYDRLLQTFWKFERMPWMHYIDCLSQRQTREENDEECINLGIKILTRCVAGGLDKEAVSKILSEGGILGCIELMKHSNIKIQESAIQLLCLLGMVQDGKAQAVKNSGIPTLLSFVKGDVGSYEAMVAAALMSITVDIDAKKALVKEQGIPALLNLLNSKNDDICLNALQLTSNIAEDPQGRKELQEGVVAAQNLLETSKKTIIKKSAEQTLQQLMFKHRPFVK